MNPSQFKYTITWTQNSSPSLWSNTILFNDLIKIRNKAHEAEEQLIEIEMDRKGYTDAQTVIRTIMSKK